MQNDKPSNEQIVALINELQQTKIVATQSASVSPDYLKRIDIQINYLRELLEYRNAAPVAPQYLTEDYAGKKPSPETLCQFVAKNYANYHGAWLCGKSSEILSFLLLMAGYECEKVTCTIGDVGHIYVRCGDLNLDPSIKQFGGYPEVWRGDHPCAELNYVEDCAWPPIAGITVKGE